MRRAVAVAAAGLLLSSGCVSEDAKKAERWARRNYVMAARVVFEQEEFCVLNVRVEKHATAQEATDACHKASTEKNALAGKLEEYRAACGRCASAEKCEAEVRRLRDAQKSQLDSLRDETACP